MFCKCLVQSKRSLLLVLLVIALVYTLEVGDKNALSRIAEEGLMPLNPPAQPRCLHSLAMPTLSVYTLPLKCLPVQGAANFCVAPVSLLCPLCPSLVT